jgi:hypothetical protein
MTQEKKYKLLRYIAYFGNQEEYVLSLRRKAAQAKTLKSKTALLLVEMLTVNTLSVN